MSILNQLPPDEREAFYKAAEQRFLQKCSQNPWVDGVEPLPFDCFVEACSGVTLTERQGQFFANAGLLRAWDIIKPDTRVQELVAMWGKGSGKDFCAAFFVAYVGYVLLHLKMNAAGYFGLKPGSRIHVINVAPTQQQARTVFFEYLRQNVQSEIFAKFLTNPRTQITADEIRFPQQNLILESMHSRAASMEGRNPFGWCMDEADDFVTNAAGDSNAKRVHRILRSSASTRFGNRWLGFVISYPRTADGFMMELQATIEKDKELLGEESMYFFDRASSWEVRPSISLATNRTMQEDYRNDPTLAAAMYECLPMPTEGAYFEFSEKIDEAVDTTGRLPAADFEKTIVTRSKGGMTLEYVSGVISNIRREPGCTYFLAGDGGLKGDTFALALFHIDETQDAMPSICERCAAQNPVMLTFANYGQEREQTPPIPGTNCGICMKEPDPLMGMVGWWVRAGGKEKDMVIGGAALRIPHVYEDLLIEFEPQRRSVANPKAKLVDFPGVQEVCRELITKLNITQTRFDPWNAASILQGLLAETGSDIDEISFSQPEQYRRSRLIKAMLYSNMITLLPNEKRDKEWKQLQRRGQKIDHPQNGSKDLYDAEAIAIWLAATYKFGEVELGWL